MFEILGRFIENECSPGHIEWYGKHGHRIATDGGERYVRDEMQCLWDWWREVYAGDRIKNPHSYDARREVIHAQIDRIDATSLISNFDDTDGDFVTYSPRYKNAEDGERVEALYKQLSALDEEQHTELQARMHRLVNIRRYLWT